MTRQKFALILFTAVSVLFSAPAFSQMDRQVKRSVATIIFSSIGGAVLGLSTMPFYGEPQEHANNITTGALLGFIAGAGYVALDSSQLPPASYEYTDSLDLDLQRKRALTFAARAPLVFKVTVNF